MSKITIDKADTLSFEALKEYAKPYNVTGKSKQAIINALDNADAFTDDAPVDEVAADEPKVETKANSKQKTPYMEFRMATTTRVGGKILQAGETATTDDPETIDNILRSGRCVWFKRYGYKNAQFALVETYP